MYSLSQPDHEWLKAKAGEQGVSVSELLRRVVSAARIADVTRGKRR